MEKVQWNSINKKKMDLNNLKIKKIIHPPPMKISKAGTKK